MRCARVAAWFSHNFQLHQCGFRYCNETRNLAIANRSRVSCAHKVTTRYSPATIIKLIAYLAYVTSSRSSCRWCQSLFYSNSRFNEFINPLVFNAPVRVTHISQSCLVLVKLEWLLKKVGWYVKPFPSIQYRNVTDGRTELQYQCRSSALLRSRAIKTRVCRRVFYRVCCYIHTYIQLKFDSAALTK